MRIIFVRHGHPNYQDDCLTELGVIQARACADKLEKEGITAIYSSTCGRAFQTAQACADRYGYKVIPLEFMREIKWGPANEHAELYHDGHPWDTVDYLYRMGVDVTSDGWQQHPYFKDNLLLESVEAVQSGFVEWMQSLGYSHKNGKWFCERENRDVVALFSHGGAGSAAMAKLLGWEFTYACSVIGMNYTSITMIDLPAEVGGYALPRIRKMNDDSHVATQKISFEM